jgi:hypothetical protein
MITAQNFRFSQDLIPKIEDLLKRLLILGLFCHSLSDGIKHGCSPLSSGLN